MPKMQELITMLQSDDPSKRYEACELLRVSQEQLPDFAIKALEVATKDSDSEVADAAQRALNLHLRPASDVGASTQEEHLSASFKWEYAEMEVTIGGPITGTQASVYFYNANGIHREIKGKMGVLFAELGNQGWELAASSARIETGLTNKHKINYLFKRQINNLL